MLFSETLKKNHEFRRLYNKGKHAVGPLFAVYCRKNGRDVNRLGITVSNKIGKAVVRNKIRRRVREIYRLSENDFLCGWDIVVVARSRAAASDYHKMEHELMGLFGKLGILAREG